MQLATAAKCTTTDVDPVNQFRETFAKIEHVNLDVSATALITLDITN